MFGRLTVRENLVVGAMAARDPSSIDEVVALFPKLGQRLHQAAGTLSGGSYSLVGGFWGDAGESIDAYYEVNDFVRRSRA